MARCYLRLRDEEACLAACVEAEKLSPVTGEQTRATRFLRAQLWSQLYGDDQVKSGPGPERSWNVRKAKLQQARDEL
eukprot:CAMPEP_0118995988 /NCGR_PEP_ID=MMETSP1173-20130426/59336_1 /TAXON_ID=1034831 /ORGANISM="Rhizochromulina marina cf, Strain CCMP1243" /LENGTH=76 /DNA_ID=CAMNT_0006947357 /DNA_START=45 /DNA_END=271 /DNA_ORIENTATION=-